MHRKRLLQRLFFIFIFMISMLTSLYAQTGTIAGTITDRETGQVLPGAVVQVEGTFKGSISDPEGRYEISGLKKGQYKIIANYIGYASQKHSIEIHENDKTTLNLVLEQTHLNSPVVEVVGDRYAAKKKEAGTIHVISESDLRLKQPLGTEELLRQVPGIHVSTDDGISNRVNIGMRGLYPRRSDKILLLEDGVPIQPALYLAPSAYYNPPPERIDGIEVIKNSSNIRFGAGTLGGVINYITNRMPTHPAGTLQLTGGENGYFSGFATYGGMIPGTNLGGQMQLLFKRGDGFRENTTYDVYNITGKLLFQPSLNTSISFKGNFHKENAFATYSALTPYMFEQNPRQNPFKDDFLATERYAVDFNLRHTFNKNIAMTATLYGNAFQRYWWRQGSQVIDAAEKITDAPADAKIRVGLPENRARLRDFAVFGFTPRWLLNFHTGDFIHDMEIGARAHFEFFGNIEIDTDRPDARVDDFETAAYENISAQEGQKRKNEELDARAYSAYVQDRIAFSALSIIPGFRIETYHQALTNKYDRTQKQDINEKKENTRTEILPALGFTYNLDMLTLHGGYYRGFLPLTSQTAFSTLIDDAGFEVNENLESEKSHNIEIGIRSEYARLMGFDIALFQNIVRNQIAAGRNASFKPIIDNLGEVSYRGIEFGSFVYVSQYIDLPFVLQLNGSFTVLRSEILQGVIEGKDEETGDVAGNEAPYAPALIYNIGANIRLPLGLTSQLTYHYVGEQFTDFNNTIEETPEGDNGKLDAYQFVNLSLRYDIPKTHLNILLSIKNLTHDIYKGSRMHRSSSGIFPGGFRQTNAVLQWQF